MRKIGIAFLLAVCLVFASATPAFARGPAINNDSPPVTSLLPPLPIPLSFPEVGMNIVVDYPDGGTVTTHILNPADLIAAGTNAEESWIQIYGGGTVSIYTVAGEWATIDVQPGTTIKLTVHIQKGQPVLLTMQSSLPVAIVFFGVPVYFTTASMTIDPATGTTHLIHMN